VNLKKLECRYWISGLQLWKLLISGREQREKISAEIRTQYYREMGMKLR
jgi:hypothetical protein